MGHRGRRPTPTPTAAFSLREHCGGDQRREHAAARDVAADAFHTRAHVVGDWGAHTHVPQHGCSRSAFGPATRPGVASEPTHGNTDGDASHAVATPAQHLAGCDTSAGIADAVATAADGIPVPAGAPGRWQFWGGVLGTLVHVARLRTITFSWLSTVSLVSSLLLVSL